MSVDTSASAIGELGGFWAPSPGQALLLRAAYGLDLDEAFRDWRRWLDRFNLVTDRLEPGSYAMLPQVYRNLARTNTTWAGASILRGVAKKQWLTLQLHRHTLRAGCQTLDGGGVPFVLYRGHITHDACGSVPHEEPIVVGQIAVQVKHTGPAMRLLSAQGMSCTRSIRRAIAMFRDFRGGQFELIPVFERFGGVSGYWSALYEGARSASGSLPMSTLMLAEHQRLLVVCAQLGAWRTVPTATTIAQVSAILRRRMLDWSALEQDILYPLFSTELGYCLSYVQSNQLAPEAVNQEFLNRCLRRPISPSKHSQLRLQRAARNDLLARLRELWSARRLGYAQLRVLSALGFTFCFRDAHGRDEVFNGN